ncbi:hypothetical protein M1271_01795 [Patescibacteria group bacterium]|nr:hypothetical protein [Patescibacteria group bacterium]MCL5797174.1 hypothetical protein [Patescibacteria group bacterium]
MVKKPTVLLATGFVDGRGGSKMSSWFYDEMIDRGYKVIVATNSMYKYKLNELKLKCDVTIDLNPEDGRQIIYEKCEEGLKNVNFDYMVSMGWRTYWPYAAYKRKIPYIMVDGGIPIHYDKYPSPFIKEVYANTKLFLMTTWFNWKMPDNDYIIPKIKVVTQPYPYKRVEGMRKIRNKPREYFRDIIAQKFPEIKDYEYDLMVYLNLSDAYIDPFNFGPNNRNFVDPWGHQMADYMAQNEIEPSLFFLFKLIAGFETNYPGKVLLYLMQQKTKFISEPIVQMCKKVKTIATSGLDVSLDPFIKKAADVNICRATNCDNQADLSLIGEPCITSVVPKNYMDEDTAAIQAEKLGVCYQIQYDDPEYMRKLKEYVSNKAFYTKMSNNTANVFEKFWKTNNFWDELFKVLK